MGRGAAAGAARIVREKRVASTPRPCRSLKDIYYEEHKLTDDEIKKRHERLGYDPLDKLIQSERIALNEKKSAWTSKRDRVGKTQKQLEEMHKKEYRDRVRTLLREHIETMAELGIVFHHTFRKDRLGFQILIARYGEEGREYFAARIFDERVSAPPRTWKFRGDEPSPRPGTWKFRGDGSRAGDVEIPRRRVDAAGIVPRERRAE